MRILLVNPNTTASMTQRNGHGKALRTAMRGALTVKRRRSRRNRMTG
jgi:Asp/Glu/hydantoin racemase